MPDIALELIQFPYSHYNEKARWALDWKRVPHSRTSLLPGPHALRVKRLTGASETPVLRAEAGEIIAGSAAILDWLERRHPEPALLPADPVLRARALEIQRRFDEEFGPLVRRALFSLLLGEPGYVVRLFAGHRSRLVRALYRASFPLAVRMLRGSLGVDDPAAVEAGFEGTQRALDFVAKESADSGYLVGDVFSLADLAAAALLSPCANPPHPAIQRPEPQPPCALEWHARWRDHPGLAWVLEIYRRHRPERAPGAAPIAARFPAAG